MLNGVAPLLLFEFAFTAPQAPTEGLPGVIDDAFGALGGIPIPIYLDENLTGIFIQDENQAIDIATTVRARYDVNPLTLKVFPPDVSQQVQNNQRVVNMVASKDSVFLSVLLSFADEILNRVVGKTYRVSYFNGPTVLFKGYLKGFNTSSDPDNTKLDITMTLEKVPGQDSQALTTLVTIARVLAALPPGVLPS